jgi:hypothetical protein
MGLFGPKSVKCPSGQWTDILSTAFVGLPASWEVVFISGEGKPVDGEYVQKRTAWIFPQAPEQGRIQQNMVFRRCWINTFYRVSIKPASELVAQVRRLT